jgi:hypothetical protein
MNKIVQNLFIWLLPFYPIWGWLCLTYTNKPILYPLGMVLVLIAAYLLVTKPKKLPKYVLFYILFACYHVGSIIYNNTFPRDANKFNFIFFLDDHVRACLFFIIIEYTIFDDEFINKLNKRVLIIVVISVIVSLIQSKKPEFFFNTSADEDFVYISENRVFSIYSWLGLNSGGVTFPFLISILINVYKSKKPIVLFSTLGGIVVAFLTKSRYVMISTLIVLSQFLIDKKISIAKIFISLTLFMFGIFIIVIIAQSTGYDINKVINERILEKGNNMGSAKTRVLSFEVFMKVFPDNPWFGVGPATRQNVIDLLMGEAVIIHIGFLGYLYYYGIVGCSIFYIAIFFILQNAWNVGRRDDFWAVFYGLAAFLLANFTFEYFNFSEMGIVISMLYLRYFNYQSTLELEESLVNN